jgi:hypothetical protein
MVRRRPGFGTLLALFLPVVIAIAGCNRIISSITGPSETWRATLPAWSPYVVVQPDSAALGGYQTALSTLTAHSAVRGVRIGLYADGSSGPTVRQAASLGLDVLGIIDNADLFRPDLERMFDDYRAAYPQVRVFQVGNEITTASQPMGINDYIDVLARVYAHVVQTYPDVTLVSQSEFGAGTQGASELSILGPAARQRGLSSSKLIFGINVYTETALAAYTAVIQGLPGDYRIWVTETGVGDQSSQVSYVTFTYPRLQAQLRAERVYWYALWSGDTGTDTEYSLIKSPTNPPIVPGPLFQRLTATN